MEKKVVVRPVGIGLLGALFLVFLVLKLTGVIAWSWWWITAPLWLPWVAIFGSMGLFFGGLYLWIFIGYLAVKSRIQR